MVQPTVAYPALACWSAAFLPQTTGKTKLARSIRRLAPHATLHPRNLGPYCYFADEDDDDEEEYSGACVTYHVPPSQPCPPTADEDDEDDEEYSGARRKSGDRRGGASSSAAGRHRRKGAGNPGAWRLCKLLATVVHGADWRDQSMAREGLEAGCRRSQAGSMHESPPAALGPPGMWRGVHLAAPPPCPPRWRLLQANQTPLPVVITAVSHAVEL